MFSDISEYLKTLAINELGLKKFIFIVSERNTSWGLTILKDYPEILKSVIFISPKIQRITDPLVIKTYAKWMTEVDVPVLVTFNNDDKDGQDSKKIFGFLKKVEYKEVKDVL